MVRDNADVLERLRTEEATLNSENASAAEREATTRAAFEQAASTLAQSEAKLAALTAERAEAAASRHQIERTLRETAERRDRFARQLAEVDRELSDILSKVAGLPDPAEKRVLVEQAMALLEESEAAVAQAEQSVIDARAAESAARPPLQDARAELARIETEARTLAKILNAASGDLFPSVLEQISVERGFETALGAALGEDLDVPLDRSAPAHWGESQIQPGDAALPEDIKSLASVVRAPAQLARRLAQIGIVEAADGRRLQALLAPGQRLVSREGALWRWDGLTASADAPTAAPKGWRRRTGLPNSMPKPCRRHLCCARPRRRWHRRSRHFARLARPNATRARPDATPSTGWTLPATRWPRPRRPAANWRAGARHWMRRVPASSTAMRKPPRLRRGRNAAAGRA